MDPPWQFKVYSDKGQGRSAERHYQTMTMEEIKNLPVCDLADKDCAMFMWTTLPVLKESFSVLERWGFEYKTVAFEKKKKNRKADSLFWGMGYWTRSNAEVCLLATRGNPKRLAANVHQVIISRIEEHSRKPEEARSRIEQLMGDVPKIELFARRKAVGWDVWGNEVESDIQFP